MLESITYHGFSPTVVHKIVDSNSDIQSLNSSLGPEVRVLFFNNDSFQIFSKDFMNTVQY